MCDVEISSLQTKIDQAKQSHQTKNSNSKYDNSLKDVMIENNKLNERIIFLEADKKSSMMKLQELNRQVKVIEKSKYESNIMIKHLENEIVSNNQRFNEQTKVLHRVRMSLHQSQNNANMLSQQICDLKQVELNVTDVLFNCLVWRRYD